MSAAEPLPAIPLESWRPAKETLHRFTQIVGKIALAKGIRRNHWWHMTYRLTARGWTTLPLGNARGGPVFTCAFDVFDEVLRIATTQGEQVEVGLVGQSVGSFYREVMAALAGLGIEVALRNPYPFDLPDSARPFADDTEHAHYEPHQVRHAFAVLGRVALILEEFSAGYSGKISPVHLFWHTFDLAVQRFSNRRIDMPPTVDSVTREAYSREMISAGFWFGDDKVPEPTFYSYTAPEPEGLARRPLRPAGAHWVESGSAHSAYYAYDEARRTGNPVEAALEFFRSAYANGSELAGWDTAALACPGGITDPVLGAPDT